MLTYCKLLTEKKTNLQDLTNLYKKNLECFLHINIKLLYYRKKVNQELFKALILPLRKKIQIVKMSENEK